VGYLVFSMVWSGGNRRVGGVAWSYCARPERIFRQSGMELGGLLSRLRARKKARKRGTGLYATSRVLERAFVMNGRKLIMRAMVVLRFPLTLVFAASLCLAAQAQDVWQMQESGTTAGLRGIDSVDGTVAWASGTGGTVLRTVDGGAHWIRCAVPDGDKDGTTLDFRGVQAWDANTAIVMASGPGDKSRLYKTVDGCKTWRLLLTNPDGGGFWDPYRRDQRGHLGILIGDPVGGRFPVWRIDPEYSPLRLHHAPKAHKGEAAFAASNSAIFVDDVFFDFWIATGGKSGARVIKRIDHDFDSFGFDTFPSSVVPVGQNAESSGVFGLSFRKGPKTADREKDFLNGIAVGGDYSKPNDAQRTAAWTADGGNTWTASTIPPHGYRSSVQWGESIKAWIAAGTNGSDISRDDGKTWQPLDNGNWNALSLPFVVGPKGRIGRLNAAAIPKP